MEEVTSTENTNHRLSVEYASRIFIASFQHSQGSDRLQNLIFDYLHVLNPIWKLPNQLRVELQSLVNEPVEKIVKPLSSATEPYTQGETRRHIPIMLSEIKEAIEIEAVNMQRALNSDRETNSQEIITNIGLEILQQDKKYLTKEDGRVRRMSYSNTRYSPIGDPFLSYACYYALEYRTTGIKEYDQMYREIGNFYRGLSTQDKGATTLRLLEEVISLYSERHTSLRNEFDRRTVD